MPVILVISQAQSMYTQLGSSILPSTRQLFIHQLSDSSSSKLLPQLLTIDPGSVASEERVVRVHMQQHPVCLRE